MHVSREGRGKAKKGYKTEMGRRVCERLRIIEGWGGGWVSLSKRRVSGFKGERLEIAVDVKSDARATGLQDRGATGLRG